MSDIKDRLLAACNGHPTAAIPWPHRLLHDAIDQIEAQQARIAELEQQLADLREAASKYSGDKGHAKWCVGLIDDRECSCGLTELAALLQESAGR